MTSAIRKLAFLELPLYADHLKRLPLEDRYLRFGYHITDDAIQKYVDSQYRIKQIVLGVFEDDRLIAALEVVFDQSKYIMTNTIAEVGLTVEPEFRRNGLGSSLFAKAIELARNRSVTKLVSHCLTQNRWMMRIAKDNGMTVISDEGESTGSLTLDQADVSTVLGEVLGDGMAIWDYGVMRVGFNNPGFTASTPIVPNRNPGAKLRKQQTG